MKNAFLLLLSWICIGCGSDDSISADPIPIDPIPVNPNPVRYLALGDSYTIGQSVCETCRFPEQLKTALESATNRSVDLEIIATTGWTTTNLISAITSAAPESGRDLVTLLIGVNNQYQHQSFSVYESEFPQLVNTAVSLANGDKSKVIVVSIPDYAYTPYGQFSSNPNQISAEIDQYNDFARQYCQDHDIVFVGITDITREGLDDPSLVAPDGLHPSATAYTRFVSRILPEGIAALN